MSRSSGSKKGLTALKYIPSSQDANIAEALKNAPTTTASAVISTTIIPPTSIPLPANIILPPSNIIISPQETFSASSTGTGSISTYVCTKYHGMTDLDTVITTNFTNSLFNGSYRILSYTGKTFTVASTASGTSSSGTVVNSKNPCGTLITIDNGSTTVDLNVSFEQVLNAVDYRLEVIKVD